MTRIRERFAWAMVAALSMLALAALAGVAQGGPLDPPGPVGSTGKNVITSLPFTISSPGSYVLNSNLTGVSGQNGITVNAANVTIDLQGFELVGVSGGGDAIQGNAANITVRDGTIRNWDGAGFYALSDAIADGLRLNANVRGLDLGPRSAAMNCLVTNSSGGYAAQLQNRSSVTNCRIENNAGGLRVYADSNVVDTIVVRAVTTQILGDERITIENCHADGGGASASNGIQVGPGSVVRGCTVINNAGVEILAGAKSDLENCVADGFGTAGNGIEVGADSVVRGCTATNNGGHEIVAGDGTLIEDCVVDGWNGSAAGPGNGIVVANDSTVRGCNTRLNAGDGVAATGQLNRIEGNRSYSNGGCGFNVDGGGNVGIQNTAGFNTAGNYTAPSCIAAGNQFAVITGTSGATNPFANIQ